MDWHQAHWLELARQSSQVRRLGVGSRGRSNCAPAPPSSLHPHSLGPGGSLAAEWGTLLWALQGTPTPAPAGCMQHPLCGWCSDATHRRGPRELKKELESSLAIYLGIHKQLLPSPAPPHRPPLQAPFPPPLPVSPDFLLQPMASMGSAFPAPTPFWGKEPLCLVQLQLMDP